MTTSQREMRRMLSRRWRERDARGVWFWGSWLLIRWNMLPIIAVVLSVVVGYFLAGGVR